MDTMTRTCVCGAALPLPDALCQLCHTAPESRGFKPLGAAKSGPEWLRPARDWKGGE